jgi:hypothetical protein
MQLQWQHCTTLQVIITSSESTIDCFTSNHKTTEVLYLHDTDSKSMVVESTLSSLPCTTIPEVLVVQLLCDFFWLDQHPEIGATSTGIIF